MYDQLDFQSSFRRLKSIQKRAAQILFAGFLIGTIAGCANNLNSSRPAKASTLDQDDAGLFITQVEKHYSAFGEYQSHINWLQATHINYDSNWLAARAEAEDTQARIKFAKQASHYNNIQLPPNMRRKMEKIKLGLNLAAPDRPGAATELAQINNRMRNVYATGTIELNGKEMVRNDLEEMMGTIRDPKMLSEIWTKWREVSPASKNDYRNMVELTNEGARELGFSDTGAMWRSTYDMPADDFAAETDRLWNQVKPLYDALHCQVRDKLNKHYGDKIVPLDQPIRADLLGNMWAQEWLGVFDLVAPPTKNNSRPFDLTQALIEHEFTPHKMVTTGEDFFSSLGFDPLPKTFYERSLFTRPQDREVVCHASAWNVDGADDIRIKMCTKVNGIDFKTVYHELGHNYYQRAYKHQSPIFQEGANGGFHEAIGDMVALSITPSYLKQIGLMHEVPPPEQDLAILMNQALDKIAFLPFGLLMDKWRWQVFSGATQPDEYNSAWWRLREQYQGIRPPTERQTHHFDPGSKYHIANNVSYTRYFIATILQFQFHQAACKISGQADQTPLHRCSVYNSKAVGERFKEMLSYGQVQPWPQTLAAFTGTTKMDGQAVVDYFQPLMDYLEEANQGLQCGW